MRCKDSEAFCASRRVCSFGYFKVRLAIRERILSLWRRIQAFEPEDAGRKRQAVQPLGPTACFFAAFRRFIRWI